MKNILVLLFAMFLVFHASAQTNSLQVPNLFPPITNDAALTSLNPTVSGPNAGAIQNGFSIVLNGVFDGGTNFTYATYLLYANGLKSHFGGGVGIFEPVSQYLLGGVRFDYVDGGFWMPSGNATFQIPLSFATNIYSALVLTPFSYVGIGVPLSGALITTTVGSFTVPGSVRDNNGQATAIFGIGLDFRVWQSTATGPRPWYQPRQISGVFDYEKWSGFNGAQWRFGVRFK